MLARLVSRFHTIKTRAIKIHAIKLRAIKLHVIKNWLGAVFSHDRPISTSASCASWARVIEFYVPESFQAPQRDWRTQEARGKLIEFSARGVRKSA